MVSEKTYEPHIILIWDGTGRFSFKNYSNKEDALDKYIELVEQHFPKIILAKVVRQHGEG